MDILLIEYDSEIRTLLKTFLEIRGHQVVYHEDGASGWAAYQARTYPLVIVDCSLPGGDGLELCQKIRGTPTGFESIIMVITMRTRLGNLGQVLAAGADDYLERPVDLHHFSIRLAIAEQRVNTLIQQAANIKSLIENSELLNEAQHIAQVGSWKLDLRTDELIWSDEIFHILEVNRATTPATYEMFLNMVHPEDRDEVSQAFKKNAAEHHTPWEITHRLCMPDGRIKWIKERCETLYDEFGKPLSTAGAVQDITVQRNTEEELQFAASINHSNGDAVMISDSSNRIVAVNQAFTQLSGYTPDEAIGRPSIFMYAEHHGAGFKQAIFDKLNNTGSWEGEIWNRRKNGMEYPIWQLIHTIYDDNGNVLRRVTLFSDVTDPKLTKEPIRRHAYYDALTGIPNRRLFEERLRLDIKRADRANLPIALLLIDIDNFKEVNDALGPDVGDRLLKEAARRISACVQNSGMVARLGGDEFIVILSEVADAHQSIDVAQKVISSLAEPYHVGGVTIHESASIGITLYPNDAIGIGALMKNADHAMFVAKNNGGNQFSQFKPSFQQTEGRRMLASSIDPIDLTLSEVIEMARKIGINVIHERGGNARTARPVSRNQL